MPQNVSNKKYLTAFINNSSTVREKAGADITNAAHLAVMYNANGDAVLATSGESAFGIILSDARSIDNGTDLITKQGTELDIIIKNIGLIQAGAAVSKGDPLTINANSQAVPAASDDFIFGWAFTSAENVGELVHIQITRSGYKS